MISDDDVMSMFEQADPARLPDCADNSVDGAGYLAALRRRSTTVALPEMSRAESSQTATPTTSSRWGWVGAAAAAAMVVGGGVMLLARDDTRPSTSASNGTAPVSATVDVAEEFIDALNRRDLAAVEAVSAEEFVMDGGVGVVREVDVRCELFERNRLTDATGAERPATVRFVMSDGQVESVSVRAYRSDFDLNAFVPFRSWVRLNHPDDVGRMWTAGLPVLNAESVALWDRNLTDYTALVSAKVDVAEEFIDALNRRDLAAVEAVSADGFTMNSEVGVGLEVGELPSLMAWYDAFDWRWEDPSCVSSTLGADVRCELFERNRLTVASGAARPATVSFSMSDGLVESVDVDADLSDYALNAFVPFKKWVWVNHPDDVGRMWNGSFPVLNAESVALFDRNLTDYTGEVVSRTED
jgi:hypothetical protein